MDLRGSFGWNVFTEDGLQNVPFSTEEGTFLQCLTSLFGAPLIPGIPCVAPDGSVPASAVTGLATGGAATAIPYRSVFENQGQNDSYSVFADVTYLATDSLELTAGLRYLWEDRQSGYRTDVPNSVLSGAPLIPGQIDTGGQTFTAEDSLDAWLPRFNVLYRISPEVNVFATVSVPLAGGAAIGGARHHGRRGARAAIGPRRTWNTKAASSWPAAGSRPARRYYQVYDNFQVSVEELDANGNPTGGFVTESAAASNLGVEAEIAVEAADWLSIFANVGYIDGGIDEDNSFTRVSARFRLQPEWQAAAGFTVDYPLGNGARLFATPSNAPQPDYFEVPNSDVTSQGPVTGERACGGQLRRRPLRNRRLRPQCLQRGLSARCGQYRWRLRHPDLHPGRTAVLRHAAYRALRRLRHAAATL